MSSYRIIIHCCFLISVGCGTQPYPPTLTYPLRSDPLVLRLPSNAPEGPPAAGKLDEFIAAFNERGGLTRSPSDLAADAKQRLQQILEDRFGNPAAPIVSSSDGQAQAIAECMQLDAEKLAAGSKHYKQHCLQCHGLTGDGRGPTGQWVYPFPRDFRQGVFKYVSSSGSGSRKPRRDDLRRMLQNGIERTSMPPFALLPENEREAIIAYTIHLSVRGEVEFQLMSSLLAEDLDIDDMASEADTIMKKALQQWRQADSDRIEPATQPTPTEASERAAPAHWQSITRGHQLFSSPSVGCISCHVDYGRQARYLYDCWGSAGRPSDLTEGVYRGGKQPLDVYQRIHGGIAASGMPAATSLTEAQVWDLVHFVLALPVPSMLPAEVREKVYSGR